VNKKSFSRFERPNRNLKTRIGFSNVLKKTARFPENRFLFVKFGSIEAPKMYLGEPTKQQLSATNVFYVKVTTTRGETFRHVSAVVVVFPCKTTQFYSTLVIV